MKKTIKTMACALLVAGGVQPAPTYALESLSDTDMSTISGQDGLSFNLSSSETSFDRLTLKTDVGEPQESQIALDQATLKAVEPGGANVGAADFLVDLAVDAGSDGATSGLAVDLDWSRIRTRIEDIRIGSDSVNSLGTVVVDSNGSLTLVNGDGWFNTGSQLASLDIDIRDADIYYRQGGDSSPELLLSNLDFRWAMPSGTVGFDADGLLIEGNVDFNYTFDLRFDETPLTPFTFDANDSHGLRFGWTGGLVGAQVKMRGGGLWQETSLLSTPQGDLYDQDAKTGGVNLGFRWDFDPSFRWVIGKTLDAGASLEFGNWTKLPGADYGFDFPLITLDAIHAGQGPGGLCWGANWAGPASPCISKGGEYLDVAPENNALAVAIRDGQLGAYSTVVNLLDPEITDTFNWGLIYTWGDFDGNLYIYPGGQSSSSGMRMDLLAMIQTFDTEDADGDGNLFEQGRDWDNGTHFMIADTDANLAVGFMNSSFLAAANDLYVTLGTGAQRGLQLSTTQEARLAMTGMFGGGDIPDLNERLDVAILDVNLEMNEFEFAIYPEEDSESKYLGYRASLELANTNVPGFSGNTNGDVNDDGSYISLAEPSRPDVDIRFADIRGSIDIVNGKLDLLSATADKPAQLVIANDLLIGRSASGGTELMANRVELGNRNLGQMVIPGGQWRAELTLSPQN